MNVQISLFVLVLAVAACSGNKATPQPAPDQTPPQPETPVATGPEIVELPIPDDELPPDDCTAAGVDGGVLDQTSASYKRIEVKKHKQFVWQKATLADGTVVTAQVGGCAHHGSSYVVQLPKDKPVSDRGHYLGAALVVVSGLALRAGSDNYTAEIAKEIKPALGDPKKLETCDFPRSEMDRVMCGVAEEDDGKVHVTLAYDIAL